MLLFCIGALPRAKPAPLTPTRLPEYQGGPCLSSEDAVLKSLPALLSIFQSCPMASHLPIPQTSSRLPAWSPRSVLQSFLTPYGVLDPTIERSLQPWIPPTALSPASSSLSVNSGCWGASPCLVHPIPLSRRSPLFQSVTLKIRIEMIKI